MQQELSFEAGRLLRKINYLNGSRGRQEQLDFTFLLFLFLIPTSKYVSALSRDLSHWSINFKLKLL